MKIEIEIKDLPIHCKDCKHYNKWAGDGWGTGKCENSKCPVFGHEVAGHWYCKDYELGDNSN